MSAATPNFELGREPLAATQEQQQQQHSLAHHDDEKKGALASSDDSDSDRNGGIDGENPTSTATAKRKYGQLSGVALIFACGASLFSDGYVNAIAGPVNTMITKYSYADAPADELKRFTTLFPSMAFVGTVVGMLSFGVLADTIGRKWGMLVCSAGLILFSILAAGAWGAGGSTGGLFAALIAYRFLIGIFIGGEYPCGSVACAENTEQDNIKKTRQQAWFVLATNSCIDVAFILAPFIALILVWITGEGDLNPAWRVLLGLGAIPPLSLLFFRARMREPDSYKKAAIRKKLPWWIIIKKYWVRLTAVSLVWFAYDFVSYPAGIYSSFITTELFPDAGLKTNLAFSIAISAFYLGTFVGAAVIDRLGPKYTIMLFLALQAVFGFALAGAFGYWRNHVGGLIAMTGLYIAFGEAGPGNCLGLLASKAVAPTAVRGRFYGIAAAIGKVGAFVGTYTFTPLQERFPEDSDNYYAAPYYVGSALAVVAFFLVLFFVPAVQTDGIRKMDEEFLTLLRESGYDMDNVGLDSTSTGETIESANNAPHVTHKEH